MDASMVWLPNLFPRSWNDGYFRYLFAGIKPYQFIPYSPQVFMCSYLIISFKSIYSPLRWGKELFIGGVDRDRGFRRHPHQKLHLLISGFPAADWSCGRFFGPRRGRTDDGATWHPKVGGQWSWHDLPARRQWQWVEQWATLFFLSPTEL